MGLTELLAIGAVCLSLAYTMLYLVYKLLRYRDVRKPESVADLLNLLTASTCDLEAETEARLQLSRFTPRVATAFSLEDFLQEEVGRRTEVECLMAALGDSPFFKTLHRAPLRVVAETLQQEEQSGCLPSDCFYQSECGIQQLFVLPASDSAVSLQLDNRNQFDVPTGSRVLLSPSSLACALLSLPCPAQFRCSLHGRFGQSALWTVPFSDLVACLSAWPEARRGLLQQFWSHVNDVILLVLIEWLNLDAFKFLEAAGYDELLARATERLAEEQLVAARVEFAAMSLYERRPLYRRLALGLLCEIAGCGLDRLGAVSETEVTVTFYSPSVPVSIHGAFLVLDGRIDAVTHPTLSRHLAHTYEPTKGQRGLPGWVGLTPYFSCSPLPFGLSSGAAPEGVILAQLSDRLLDRLFRSPGTAATPAEASAAEAATSSAFESATRYLLRQLNPQFFREDLLVKHRRLHRGDQLVRQGELAETVEIVVSGRVRHATSELGRGECVGLIQGMVDSGEGFWTRDVVALRDSRAVSLPLSLVRCWVSRNHRLHIMDRALSFLCHRELVRQSAASASAACASDDGISSDDDEDEMSADLRDAKQRGLGQETGEQRQPRNHREESLVGFMIDGRRFNRSLLLLLLRRCLAAAHGPAARLVSDADVLEHFGRPAEQLPEAALRNWLEEQELSYPTLVLACSDEICRWTRLVLGYLDCLVVCCDADAAAGNGGEMPSDVELYYSQMFRCRVHLAVFHPLTLCPVPCGASVRFLRHRHWWTRRVFHVRCSTGYYKAASGNAATNAAALDGLPTPAFDSDLARLVRLTTGRAVGVAFDSGGGCGCAQGLAGLGALEALLEEGVVVDMAAGSGRGALIAAAWALHHPNLRVARAVVERLLRRVDGPLARLRDLTLPLVSTFTGAGLNCGLRDLFGPHRQMEDLWLPCVAVSTDLVAARPVSHVSGTLWRAVRASCGRVGAYPPVWEPRTGRLLVDGAHTNRLPAGTLRRRLGAHRVLAVSLEDSQRLEPGSYFIYGDQVSGWRELLRSLNPLRLMPLAPSAVDIQAALSNLAGGEAPEDDRAGGGEDGDEDRAAADAQRWCIAVRPDASFSAKEDLVDGDHDWRASAIERWRGYWSARRRLRRCGPRVRTVLHGCRDRI